MTVRSVVLSFFILSISFGILIMNEVNDKWAAEHSGTSLVYGGDMRMGYKNYTDFDIPTTQNEYNSTMRDYLTFTKPADTLMGFDFFQALKYGGKLIDLLFSSVFAFPHFLVIIGMPSFLELPMAMFLVLNHMLAVIYIVTGRTFIY